MARIEHLAIVGCGFAGTSAFFQAVERYPVSRITIFEASGAFGPGYPYRTDACADYLLNNTTDSLCIAPWDRRAFLTWLEAHPDIAGHPAAKGHVPRRVYGTFLEDMVAMTRAAAATKGISVALVEEEVVGLRQEAGGLVLRHGCDRETKVDGAILATGRCPNVDPYPHPPAGSRTRYIANHIRDGALDGLPGDATVHVMGTSLGAYDIVNRLFGPSTGCTFVRSDEGMVFHPGPNARRVVLCSRNGRLKNMQSRHPMTLQRQHSTPEALLRDRGPEGLSLGRVVCAIQLEAAAHAIDLNWADVADPYRGCASRADVDLRAAALLEQAIARAADPAARNFLVDLFANAQLDVWRLFGDRVLASAEEQRYRDTFETATLTYAAPCPISTGEKLLALLRAGRLSVIKGVRDVALHDPDVGYVISHEFGVETAHVLVNATGSVDRDVLSTRQPPLVQDLVRQGLLRPYVRDGRVMKGADIDMSTFRMPGLDNVHMVGMLLWGPGFFTSSAFLTATIVGRILACLFESDR